MMQTVPATTEDTVAEVLSWLDHEASLLEILAYRLNGLTNVLRTDRHSMVCDAASDVEAVHDQLLRAAVHRDATLASLSPADGPLARLADLEGLVGVESQVDQLHDARERIRHAVTEVEAAKATCAAAAEGYRP